MLDLLGVELAVLIECSKTRIQLWVIQVTYQLLRNTVRPLMYTLQLAVAYTIMLLVLYYLTLYLDEHTCWSPRWLVHILMGGH